MNSRIKIILFVFAVASLAVIIFNFPNRKSQEEYYLDVKSKVENKTIVGIITNKFINKDGARRTITIKSDINNSSDWDLFFEKKEFYTFLEVGDSIFKKKGALKIRLKRKNLDTIMDLGLKNIKKF